MTMQCVVLTLAQKRLKPETQTPGGERKRA
jgi:hypothetical protein